VDLEAIAQAVETRRNQLGRPWAQIARRAGVDVATLHTIRRRSNTPRPETLAAVSEALDWPADTLAKIGAGQAPPEEPSERERLDLLEQAVAELTRHVETLLTQFEDGPPGGR
jgi:transcriptional regulator with XRE-family HTH domain